MHQLWCTTSTTPRPALDVICRWAMAVLHHALALNTHRRTRTRTRTQQKDSLPLIYVWMACPYIHMCIIDHQITMQLLTLWSDRWVVQLLYIYWYICIYLSLSLQVIQILKTSSMLCLNLETDHTATWVCTSLRPRKATSAILLSTIHEQNNLTMSQMWCHIWCYEFGKTPCALHLACVVLPVDLSWWPCTHQCWHAVSGALQLCKAPMANQTDAAAII